MVHSFLRCASYLITHFVSKVLYKLGGTESMIVVYLSTAHFLQVGTMPHLVHLLVNAAHHSVECRASNKPSC